MAPDRRVRHKVEEFGVTEMVDEMLARGLTYESISDLVKERAGVDVGKSSIARYNNTLQRKLRRITQVKESAAAIGKKIAEKTGEEPDTQLSEMLLNTIQVMLMDKLAGDGEEDMDTKDLVNLAFAGSDSVRSAAALEKLKATERKRQAKAWDRVLAQSKEILQASPFWPEIEAILVAARTSAVEGAK